MKHIGKTKWILTEEQEMYICDNYLKCSSLKLAKEFNVPTSKITNTWMKYGLVGKQKRIYSINENYFKDIKTHEQAYFLGFIASDGCIHIPKTDKQGLVKITIHKQDEHILKEFSKLIKTDKPISKHGKYISMEIVSNIMVNDLNRLGLMPNKTYGNTIANIPEEFELDFIRGYLDGDGHITPMTSENMRVGISGYKKNLDKIANMLEKRNILSSFFEDKRKENKNNDVFGELSFCNKLECYCVLKLLYGDSSIKLNRKYNYALNYINDIEKSDKKSDKEILIYYKHAVQGLR